MKNFFKKIFTNIWYLWIFLTVIYVPLSFILPAIKLNLIAYALSIFVPVGFWNFGAIFNLMRADLPITKYLAIPVVALGLFVGHMINKKLPQKTWLLLIFNLLALYLIGGLTDLLIWGNWFQAFDFYDQFGSRSFFF